MCSVFVSTKEKMATAAGEKTGSKRRRHDLTLKEKYEVIQLVDRHVPYGRISDNFKCSVEQFSHIAVNRSEIEEKFESNMNSKAKCLKQASNRVIKETVFKFFRHVSSKGIPITGKNSLFYDFFCLIEMFCLYFRSDC